MTSIPITETGMNIYATITLVGDNFYNETGVGNLIAFDPNVVYTKTEINSMLNSNYSTKEDRDQLFLAYSSTNQINEACCDKAETDYSLANKVPTTGDATIVGTLNAQRFSITNTTSRPIGINNAMHNGPYLVAISQNYSNNDLLFALRCPPLNQLWCFGVATSNQYIISHENSTKLSIQSNGNTTITGNLDVGPSQAQTSIKAYFNHAGSTGHIRIEGRYRDQGFLHFETNYQYGEMFLTVRNTYFIRCSDYAGNPYVQTVQPLTRSSDDRLNENEGLIEHACETLSQLRPQLYDKKPDMENDGTTTLV